MNTFGQWLHQHEILLLCVALIFAITLALILRWRAIWMWFVWFVVCGASVSALVMLRTSAASVSEYREPEMETITWNGQEILGIKLAYSEPAPNSVEEIEKLVGKVGKPTLVEIYADWGLA
jgi:hypothetical protein